MKKNIYIIVTAILVCTTTIGKAQVSISMSGLENKPHPSAALDLDFAVNYKYGFLIPRISINNATDKSNITNPADHLLVFSLADNEFFGLNFWNAISGKWDNILSRSRLFEIIFNAHFSQAVLQAEQSTPETATHNSDDKDTEPYILRIDRASSDSQESYDDTTYKYIIPVSGIYETVCRAEVANVTGIEVKTAQLFVRKEDLNGAKSYLGNTLSTYESVTTDFNISVAHIHTFEKGEKVYCAIGVGNYKSDKYRVVSSSITIVKY